jgi:transcriptional regulator with XRE-family HTH domain
MSNKTDWGLIAKAGLTQQDFADLVGVSRVTVNYWVQGTSSPSHLLHGEAERLLGVLQDKLERGELPIELPTARDAVRESRMELLRGIVTA